MVTVRLESNLERANGATTQSGSVQGEIYGTRRLLVQLVCHFFVFEN